jgi:putative ABC transport system permease protein
MPDWKHELGRRLTGLHLPASREAEILDEVAQHLDDRYAELRRGGADDADARRVALDELAETDLMRTELRRLRQARPQAMPVAGATSRGRFGVRLWQDVRFGVRSLLRRPGFAAAATLALAIGIGANSAIFAAVDAVLLRPMPFPHADRLFVPISVNKARHIEDGSVTFADVQDWRGATDIFAGVALMRPLALDLAEGGDPERMQVWQVSEDYFRVLEVTPVAGRTFVADDHDAKSPLVGLITSGLWQQRFGGADVIGRTIHLADVPVQIVGILPARVIYPQSAQIVLPMRSAQFGQDVRTRRDNMIFGAIARLKDGVTAESANATLAAMAARLEEADPVIRKGWTNAVVPIRDDLVDRDLRVALFVLLGAVAAVLLIACANVANLALVRASGRAREFALRLSLGASRSRLVQQLVVESLLVTAAGAVVAAALAVPAMRGLVAMAPEGTPFLDTIHLNPRMLAATALASLVAVLISGLLPALSTSVVRLGDALRDGTGGSGVSRRSARLRSLLVVGEVAATVVLLTTAALLIRSFGRLVHVDPGVSVDRVVSGRLSIPSARYKDDESRSRFVQAIADRLEARPDVEWAALTSFVPVGGGGFGLGRVFLAEGRPQPPAGPDVGAQWNVVTPDYFRTLGIPLKAGRVFNDRDTATSPPVIIVSASFVRKMFPDQSPLGQRIRSWRDENLYREIVGVVDDVKYTGLSEREVPLIYVPHTQNSWGAMLVVARARQGDPSALGPGIRRTIGELDPALAVADIRTLRQSADRSIAGQRYAMLLLSVLAATALGLAVLGIYGVTSYVFALRRRELGIRLALGATRANLYALVFRHGLGLTAAGLVIGAAGSAAATRLMKDLLFDTAPTDVVSWAAMVGTIGVAALVACLLPARRAATAAPTSALRAE